jgi:hypothetical protein
MNAGRFIRGVAIAIAMSFAASCSKTSAHADGAANDTATNDGAAGSPAADIVTALPSVPQCGVGVKPSALLVFNRSLPDFAHALIVDATGIYIGAGLVIHAPIEGGNATKLSSMPIFVESFAIVGSFLWMAGEWGVPGLLRFPIQGTAPSFGPAIEGIRNVAGSEDHVFYTQDGWTDVLSYGNDLVSGPVIHAMSPADLIAISGRDVFVATKTIGAAGARIERGSTSGGPTSVVATSTSSIVSLAANTSSVYWVEAGSAAATPVARRAAHDGSTPEVVASLDVSSIAVDEGAAYLTVVRDGSVVEVAADTLQMTVLADGQVRPSAIVQYGPRVYWINDRVVAGVTMPASNAVMTACK